VNGSGVRATCPDCHVPREWIHKVIRKIRATNELYHHVVGSIDTREKFEAKRLQLAKNVWQAMKETDSRECRNCHGFAAMDVTLQEKRAREPHLEAARSGKTCIDCHKGVAHQLPAGAYEAERQMGIVPAPMKKR
jgi:cytochrome c-type protein NapC